LGITIYSGSRLLSLVKYFFPSFRAFLFWPFYILFCYSFALITLFRVWWLQPLRQGAMNVFPALIYFFLTLLVIDGAMLFFWFLKKPPLSPGLRAAGTGAAFCLTLLIMIYGAINARIIKPVYYEITLAKTVPERLALPFFMRLDQGAGSDRKTGVLRIAHISDLHIGSTVGRKWLRNIVDAVNLAKPDIICITGDIFDNNIGAVRDLEGVAEEMRRFEALLGVYGCPGNHDVDRFSLGGTSANSHIQEFLKDTGIILLLDDVELVADLFYMAGRKDASNRRFEPTENRQERKTAIELLEGLDRSMPIIVMDHQPVDFAAEEEAGADLILSGHTHRGQFFPGNLITAYMFKKAGAVHYGYWKGRFAQALVSSGAGVWGPAIRVATRSEVAVIDIVFGE
jgi:predicted MPP superfamily phosphohydrolase